MQSVLEKCFNLALGIFEHSEFEDVLINEKIFTGENKLQNCWLETIQPILKQASLKLPPVGEWKPSYGGRKGLHTEYFRPLLNEMSEVLRTDPETEW
jgi:ring-1,2-phenylacetyl-CoA epoxidase subunit PaaC